MGGLSAGRDLWCGVSGSGLDEPRSSCGATAMRAVAVGSTMSMARVVPRLGRADAFGPNRGAGGLGALPRVLITVRPDVVRSVGSRVVQGIRHAATEC